jgi:hypothetical protein
MAKCDVADFVCRPYCSFYREGVKEELICNGARLLEILENKGALRGKPMDGVGEGSSLSQEEYKYLEEIVCRPCPFYADDCDFRSTPPPPGAEPCGGFILLALLAGKGLLNMEKLKEIIDG